MHLPGTPDLGRCVTLHRPSETRQRRFWRVTFYGLRPPLTFSPAFTRSWGATCQWANGAKGLYGGFQGPCGTDGSGAPQGSWPASLTPLKGYSYSNLGGTLSWARDCSAPLSPCRRPPGTLGYVRRAMLLSATILAVCVLACNLPSSTSTVIM